MKLTNPAFTLLASVFILASCNKKEQVNPNVKYSYIHLTGRVTQRCTGEPVSGIPVEVTDDRGITTYHGQEPSGCFTWGSVKTDADGSYDLNVKIDPSTSVDRFRIAVNYGLVYDHNAQYPVYYRITESGDHNYNFEVSPNRSLEVKVRLKPDKYGSTGVACNLVCNGELKSAFADSATIQNARGGEWNTFGYDVKFRSGTIHYSDSVFVNCEGITRFTAVH